MREVSGYYEAKLEIVGGAHAGAVGSVPLIVRQSPAAPASALLVQVPVNTWEAYNSSGGKSLYQFGTSRHAFEVSFDRPFDQREFHNMGTELELPWVRFLERKGIDVSYQTDVDTDVDPGSLLRHRLVFAIGHDEYWTQRMRGAFNRALALSTNLMFGANSDEWRMRYAAGRRTIVEWRDPSIDPIHNRRLDSGFFRTFGEPECKLMGVEHQWAAQRNLTAPPTSYTVDGPTSDPWLSRDLTRPAGPAALMIRHRATGSLVSARLRAPDPRIVRVTVRPVRGGRGCADPPVGVPTTALAPYHPLYRGCNRPGGVTAADRHRAYAKRSTYSSRQLILAIPE